MNKHNGFSFILFPIIILIIGVIGFSGWYVKSKRYQADTSQSKSIVEEPRFCGQIIWISDNTWKVTCSVSVIFDDSIPTKARFEEIIKPINGVISTEYEGLQNLGIYYIKVGLGQEESVSTYLRGLPGVIEAQQHFNTRVDIH